MEISPYLSAIQSLPGQTPGEKYRHLHSIAIQIIQDKNEKREFVELGFTGRVQPALLPYLRILVGNKLKLIDFVIEALKSDDEVIVGQALRAKWFFNANNEHLNSHYFFEHIVPFISRRTRRKLIKILARCLVDREDEADNFFGSFGNTYETKEAMPLLAACSEHYINKVVIGRLKKEDVGDWPYRALRVLYYRYPELAIHYLRDVAVNISKYASFLPILVKHHTEEFAELLQDYQIKAIHIDIKDKTRISDKLEIRLSNNRAKYFLKNDTDILIEFPSPLIDLFPLKLIRNRFNKEQFVTMLESAFEKNYTANSNVLIVQLLQYYGDENKFSLLEERYKLAYGKSILENEDYKLYERMFDRLPAEKKEEYGNKLLACFDIDSDEYVERLEYMPPKESIPRLKELINIKTWDRKIVFMLKMIRSCISYDSKRDLLEVLHYLNTHHKNACLEQRSGMWKMLVTGFDIKMFDKEHWLVFREIIQRAYADGHIFNESHICGCLHNLLNGALQCFLKLYKDKETDLDAKQYVDELVDMVLESMLEQGKSLKFMWHCPANLERDCLQMFLARVPLKYPETHEIWKNFDHILGFASYLVQSMHTFNVKNLKNSEKTIVDYENNHLNQKKFMLRDYPWLVKSSADLMKESRTCICNFYLNYAKILRQHDRELYQSIIDSDPELIYQIESFEAVHLLKSDHNKVLNKLQHYLNYCQQRLSLESKAAKRFVLALKWYQTLPIKFVEQCLLDIKKVGSSLVLGILLEGDALVKVVQPYLPKDGDANLLKEATKKTSETVPHLPMALSFANPPVSFDVISDLCRTDYVSLASYSLTSVVQRVPVDQLVAFANQLEGKPIEIKTLAIHSVIRVASTFWESRKCLENFWSNEKNLLARDSVGRMVFNVFIKTPTHASISLITACAEGLTGDDKMLFEFASHINYVDKKFVGTLLCGYLNRVRDHYNRESLSYDTKSKMIFTMMEHMDAKSFNAADIQYSHGWFIVRQFLLRYGIKTFIELIEKKFEDYGKPDPKRPRSYPVNNQIRRIFQIVFCDTFSEMSFTNKEFYKELVNASVTLLLAKLKPWQDMTIFIFAYLAKDYTEAPTMKDFGAKLAVTAELLVREFGNDMVLDNIVEVLENFDDYDKKLSVIEGLTESDARFGVLIGAKMLMGYYNDERYDLIVQKWATVEDPIVRATFNNFLSRRRSRF